MIVQYLWINNQAAGFIFSVALVFFLFKRCKIKLPKTLGSCEGFCWLPGSGTADTRTDSRLEEKGNSIGSSNWDYRETFARPTMIQKARRSLHKSLTGLSRVNPLGLNPVGPQTTGVGTPRRKSFSSFFHQRSLTSTRPIQGFFSLDESSSVSVPPQPPPPLPPQYTAFLSLRPSSMPDRPTELVQDVKSNPLSPQEMPPRAFKPVSHHRISQITNVSTESKAHSVRSVRDWVKFHLPRRLQRDGAAAQQSEKPLPPTTLYTSPGL